MQVGDLIRYWPRTRETTDLLPILGIVVADLGFYEEYREEAVKVHWFDDSQCTMEKVRVLLDDEDEWYEVISESR